MAGAQHPQSALDRARPPVTNRPTIPRRRSDQAWVCRQTKTCKFDWYGSLSLARQLWAYADDLEAAATTRIERRRRGPQVVARASTPTSSSSAANDEQTSLTNVVAGLRNEATGWAQAWKLAMDQQNRVLYARKVKRGRGQPQRLGQLLGWPDRPRRPPARARSRSHYRRPRRSPPPPASTPGPEPTMTTTSAVPADLAEFVTAGGHAPLAARSRRSPRSTSLQRSVLANSPDYGVSRHHAAGRRRDARRHGRSTRRFVTTVHDALVAADVSATGVGHDRRHHGRGGARRRPVWPRPPGPVTVEPAAAVRPAADVGVRRRPDLRRERQLRPRRPRPRSSPGWTAVLDVVRTYNSLATDTDRRLRARLDVGARPAPRAGRRRRRVGPPRRRRGRAVRRPTATGVFRAVGPRPLHITARRADGGWILHEGHTKQWRFDADGTLRRRHRRPGHAVGRARRAPAAIVA